jgi:RND family efflux transporter MFP subunit
MPEDMRSLFQRCFVRATNGAIVAAFLLTIQSCSDKNTYVPPPPPIVTVSQPLKRPVVDSLEFTGNAVAFNTVPLRARVEGYLEKILFQDGQNVNKGQLLMVIQQEQYKAQFQKAQASLLAEKAQLEHAQTEYVRYANLVKQDAAAQTDVDRWHYERDSRRAAVLAAEAQIQLAKLNLSYTTIIAPFKGRMGRHLKDVGSLVGAGEPTLLAEINQIDPIYIYFNINEQDLLRVRGKNPERPGETEKKKYPVYVGLADETGFPHQGYLDFVAITLNPTTGSLMLRAILPNPNAFILPGLFTRVQVPVAEMKDGLLVPEAAISYDQIGAYVRVVNATNIVERRDVKLGTQVDTRRVVLEGLSGDDWVVVTGVLRAIPGRPVTPTRSPAPPDGKPTSPADPGTKKAVP